VPLQYNVSTLLTEPIGSTREYDVDSGVLIDEEEPRHEHVSGHARFLRTRDGMLVTARLSGVQRDRCSRCLSDVDVAVSVELDEEFFASVDVHSGARLPPPDDLEAFRIDPQQTLDLEEVVRQSWMTALPMQPLCRPECAGLCPRCGKDLNEGACACQPEGDERWSALRGLQVQLEGK